MDTLAEELTEGLRRLRIEAAPGDVERLMLHARRVLETNMVMNLTSIAEADFVRLHILDSLSALPFLQAEADGPFADLGSGAGYPGIPLAIMTGRPLTLVESVRKKAAFLEAVCAELRLEAAVQPVRAEVLGNTQSGAFGSIVARALSALPSLVELASPLLAAGGTLICLKGKLVPRELERGDAAGALCGLRREQTESVTVPDVDADRTIVVYRKTGSARARLPRRTGLAQRRPLA